MSTYRVWHAAVILLLLATSAPASAQETNGFTINRYEPTAAGEWSFAVDHPWYTSTRHFAAGFTLNYGHEPLVFGPRDASGNVRPTTIALAHQLLGHVDLAGALFDRVNFSATLPITLLERGTPVGGFTPLGSGTAGDPRLGFMVRLFGQPDASPFSVNVGALVWIPVGTNDRHAGDTGLRILPKLVLAGLGHRVRWSVTGGFYYRPESVIGNLPRAVGNSSGSELQLGASLYYADLKRRWAIGHEAIFGTAILGGNAFDRSYSSLEVLLGIHYNIARQVQLGAAGAIGLLRQPGTPDFRFLFRLAYAPIRAARKAVIDRDGDTIADPMDRCPTEPAGVHPDPQRPGCPAADGDGDGVYDFEDQCPMQAAGAHPDPARKGCLAADSDGDGSYDFEDQCPTQAAGAHPDPARKGCPAADSDGDGVYDHQDACPNVAQGIRPDPDRPGCPLPDRDNDQVIDRIDACPDQPGAPDPDPKKNGCPGLVTLRASRLHILQQVYFATNKDVILRKSFPVLQAVANALQAQPEIKRLSIEGHTDNTGDPQKNRELSERRARSVMRWLIAHGVDANRLEAHGFGQDRPIADNRTQVGRNQNRRVEFHIIDPSTEGSSPPH